MRKRTPDFTGDINNYTIWFSTSNAKLATQLRKVGVDAQLVPVIEYDYQSDNNSLTVRVPAPFESSLALSGSVLPSQRSWFVHCQLVAANENRSRKDEHQRSRHQDW